MIHRFRTQKELKEYLSNCKVREKFNLLINYELTDDTIKDKDKFIAIIKKDIERFKGKSDYYYYYDYINIINSAYPTLQELSNNIDADLTAIEAHLYKIEVLYNLCATLNSEDWAIDQKTKDYLFNIISKRINKDNAKIERKKDYYTVNFGTLIDKIVVARCMLETDIQRARQFEVNFHNFQEATNTRDMTPDIYSEIFRDLAEDHNNGRRFDKDYIKILLEKPVGDSLEFVDILKSEIMEEYPPLFPIYTEYNPKPTTGDNNIFWRIVNSKIK